jgi:hypothetical protein
MGAWGVQPWDNDRAADWFATFFAELDIDALRAAFEYCDAWDEIRAACYVFQTLAGCTFGRRSTMTRSRSCWRKDSPRSICRVSPGTTIRTRHGMTDWSMNLRGGRPPSWWISMGMR